MQTRLRLRHAWTRQMQALLPAARVTRVRALALVTLGVLWASPTRDGSAQDRR